MYKLIGENDIYNPIEQVLKNRGLTYKELNPSEDCEIHYSKLDNIDKAAERLIHHIDNNNKICIIVDSDTDGITSFSILYKYLKEEFPNLDLIYKTHKTKEHGLSKDITIEDGISLVILPDASSGDHIQHKELYDRGIDVIVLDHHEVDNHSGYTNWAIIVNNQLSKNYSNKSLSGAGIVYKFLQALDDYLYTDNADKYLDTVALGCISDVVPMTVPETRFLTKKGLGNINNEFIKALIKEKEFEIDGKLNFKSVAFNLAPLINGTIRGGNEKEKDILYGAFLEDDEETCSKISKMTKSVKQRQDSGVKTALNKIEMCLKYKPTDKVIIADAKGMNKAFTGLVAGKLSGKYKVPVLLYNTTGDTIGGSARSPQGINFREDVLSTGLMIYSQGHNQAFGFGMRAENIEKLKAALNEKYSEIDFGNQNTYNVDFELENYELDQQFIEELSIFENEVSKGFDEVLIAIKNVELFLTDENVKGRLNIVFDVNGVKFIKKFTSNVWKSENLNKEMVVDIIARPVIDTYSGYGILEIVDMLKN